MSKLMVKIACGLIIMVIVIGGLVGCSGETDGVGDTTDNGETEEVGDTTDTGETEEAGDTTDTGEPDYASAMVESALQSTSDCDYATHVALYVPEVQDAFTEDAFNTGCQQIKAIIGDYIDKEFEKAEVQGSYIVVYYTARYSDEPDDVEVTVCFQKIDDEMYIALFWLSSPKLIEAATAATGE